MSHPPGGAPHRKPVSHSLTRLDEGVWAYAFSTPYFAAATEVTCMVSPSAVPVTVACLSASLSRASSAALSSPSSVYTLLPTTRAYLEPFATQARVQAAAVTPASMCSAPHI